jgi:hypothetical protein
VSRQARWRRQCRAQCGGSKRASRAAAPLAALLADTPRQLLRDLGPRLGAQLRHKLQDLLVFLSEVMATGSRFGRVAGVRRAGAPRGAAGPLQSVQRRAGEAGRRAARASAVHGPLTSSGLSTFCQR